MKLKFLTIVVVAAWAVSCSDGVSNVVCPVNYINIRDKCLMFVGLEKNWDEATVYCTEKGGSLAMNIDEALLYQDLLWYIDSHSDLVHYSFWVGGSDRSVEGMWKWTNGDHINMGSLFWGVNDGKTEPSGGSQNCLCMYGPDRHRFHDQAGNSDVFQFMCQANPVTQE